MTPEPGTESVGDCLRRLVADGGGAISVERFMREALYHPRHGYYSRRVRTVGRTGDFSTSPTLHQALGRAVARWATAHRREAARGGRWHLVELGGGGGQLAAAVLGGLGWWAGRGLRYHLVEISKGLRGEQQRRLAGYQRQVSWHTEIQGALHAAEGHALIFSNEFVDAFPCVQLERAGGGEPWREVCVAWHEHTGRPVETFRDWRGPEPVSPPAPAPHSQRIELHLSYRRWLAGWLGIWRQGRLLTIDYGDRPPALYHRRPGGTLRAYCRHLTLRGLEVYGRFGQQDLTADVNFGDLQAWSRELGLEEGELCTQEEFLRRWMPRRPLAAAKPDPVLARLLDPAGAGGAFKVLEQVRAAGGSAAS